MLAPTDTSMTHKRATAQLCCDARGEAVRPSGIWIGIGPSHLRQLPFSNSGERRPGSIPFGLPTVSHAD